MYSCPAGELKPTAPASMDAAEGSTKTPSVPFTSLSQGRSLESSKVNSPSRRCFMAVWTSEEAQPTARPSASVLPESPSSVTGIHSSFRNAASMQGALTGSIKKQCTFSPNTALRPNVMPPGAPPTPQGICTIRGWARSTAIFASSSCALSLSAATE